MLRIKTGSLGRSCLISSKHPGRFVLQEKCREWQHPNRDRGLDRSLRTTSRLANLGDVIQQSAHAQTNNFVIVNGKDSMQWRVIRILY
jgi:hypothetical protein